MSVGTDIQQLHARIRELKFERLMLAKLAAETPQFFNPLNAAHAKLIRDRVLSQNNRDVARGGSQPNNPEKNHE